MDSIWLVLVQFAARLTLGVALAMLCSSPRSITNGFFRVHLWVLMGVQTFAALIVYSSFASFAVRLGGPPFWLLGWGVILAVVCYIGAVIWMYEAQTLGRFLLACVVMGAFVSAWLATPGKIDATLARAMGVADILSASLLLGFSLTSMFLGHWYLNTPSMQLTPLRRLVAGMAGAVLVRALVAGLGLAMASQLETPVDTLGWVLLVLRWLTGIAGPLLMAGMTWQTLKIPNTQSATGILYAAVTLVFSGELTAQLLCSNLPYPL